jgi:hypothetical protein
MNFILISIEVTFYNGNGYRGDLMDLRGSVKKRETCYINNANLIINNKIFICNHITVSKFRKSY